MSAPPPISFRMCLAAGCVLLTVCSVVAAGGAGERLYNGIVLPTPWPPGYGNNPSAMPDPLPPPYYIQSPPEVIPIDVGRQLFVDDFLIEKTTLKRTCHRAEYYRGNPIHRQMSYSGGVWFDPADRLFKMWYRDRGCRYAVSRDGIHWTYPSLDVKPGTNIVIDQRVLSDTVWLDLETDDPARRYVIIYSRFGDGCKYYFRFSPDGIHWGEERATGADCGDRSTAFWNPFRKVWVLSARHGWGKPRRRRYWELPDLVKGPYYKLPKKRPPLWVQADSLDPQRPDLKGPCQLYNLDAVPYESLILGYLTIWRGDYRESATTPAGLEHKKRRRPKINEVCLGFSRDGWSWSRPDRRPFCGVSEDPKAWNYGNVQSVGGGCIIMGDRLYFYVSGRQPRDWNGLAFLRRDGFVSMDADEKGGTLTTRPVRFKGKYLFVNVDAPRGELRVEVLDRDGRVIAPFTRAACTPIADDKTLCPVSWRGADDLSSLAGRDVRFRFHLRNGRLYAFWVSPDRSGASHGYVAAGGPGFTGPTDTVGAAAYEAATRMTHGERKDE